MQSKKLAELPYHVTAYEGWRALVDPNLRGAGLVAGPTIAVRLLLTQALPALSSFPRSSFLLALSDQSGGILWPLDELSLLLLRINGLSLATYLVLLVATIGLEAGQPHYPWAALIEVLVGATNGFVPTLELAIIMINILLWVAITGGSVRQRRSYYGKREPCCVSASSNAL